MKEQFKTFRRIVINHYTGPEITDFAALRVHYATGQAYLISSNPKKKYGYRHGIQCDLGDIEESEWQRLVMGLIKRCGEQKLFVPSQQKWTQKSFKKRNESYSFFCFRKTAAFIPRFA